MPTSAPFEYPTPAQLAGYRSATSALRGGTETPLFAPQVAGPMTSGLGAPQAASPPSLGRRVMAALAIRILGADAAHVLFPPQQPLQPIAQPYDYAGLGRQWNYPVGWNTRVTPRMGQRIGFPFLKALGEFDLVRIMIERVKDEVSTNTFTIGPRDKKAKRDARMDELEDLLAYPDKTHTWRDWIWALLEQVLVYDAPAIWIQTTRGPNGGVGGSNLYALQVMDGSLFTPKIMADGRLPPPEYGPAFQQILHGLPAVDYIQPVPRGTPVPTDTDGQPFPELVYKPRNPRVDIPYGYGPCEQIIRTIEIGTKREEFLLDYYTAGSVPDVFAFAPDNWNPDQIAQFQAWFESVLQGNLANRRGVRWLPGGGKPPYEPRKDALTDATDEWLIRVMCFCFGLSPTPFVKMMNRATAQTHTDQQKEEGTLPYLSYIADLINHIIRVKLGYKDVVFRWEEEEVTDPLQEAQRVQILTDAKILHPDEARQDMGLDAMSDDMRAQMDMPTFARTVTATVLPPDQQAEADDRRAEEAKQRAELAPPAGQPAGSKPPAPGVAGSVGKGRSASVRSIRPGSLY